MDLRLTKEEQVLLQKILSSSTKGQDILTLFEGSHTMHTTGVIFNLLDSNTTTQMIHEVNIIQEELKKNNEEYS